MAYETKVILLAIAELLLKSESLEDAYKSLQKIANSEGVLLEPYGQDEKNKD